MKILKVELNVLTNNPVDDNKMSQILQNTSLLDYEIILQKESKGNKVSYKIACLYSVDILRSFDNKTNKEIEDYIIGVSKDYCDEINMPIEITMSTIGHWAYC